MLVHRREIDIRKVIKLSPYFATDDFDGLMEGIYFMDGFCGS